MCIRDRLTCVFVPGQAGVLAVITTGSTVCGVGTLTAESVRACRASVYAAACPPSSTAISVNRAAAAGHLSLVACLANPGYIVVCSQVSPVMESCRLAALLPTNPASTASAAKCSCSSTCAVPLNSVASAVWEVPSGAAPSVGEAVIASARVAVAKIAIPFIRKRADNITLLLSHACRSSAASRISRCRPDAHGTYGNGFSPGPRYALGSVGTDDRACHFTRGGARNGATKRSFAVRRRSIRCRALWACRCRLWGFRARVARVSVHDRSFGAVGWPGRHRAGRSRQWLGVVPAARVWAARQSLPRAWASLRRRYHRSQEAFVGNRRSSV